MTTGKNGNTKVHREVNRVSFLAVVVALVLATTSCSILDRTETAKDTTPLSSNTVTETTPVATTSVATTQAEERMSAKVATELGVEAPTTTISETQDLQDAADVYHLAAHFQVTCLGDIPGCTPGMYAEVATGDQLDQFQTFVNQLKNDGVTTRPNPAPAEIVVFWAKPLSSDSDVVAVLGCARNFLEAVNPDGSIFDDSTAASSQLAEMRRVNGRWLVAQTFERKVVEEPGDEVGVCSALAEDITEADIERTFGLPQEPTETT